MRLIYLLIKVIYCAVNISNLKFVLDNIIIMIKSINILRIARSIFTNRLRFCTGDQFQNPNNYFKNAVNVQDFLNRLGVNHRSSGQTLRIKECMFCTKPHYNDQTNLFTLSVSKNTGVFYCHRCAAKGSWNGLKARLLGIEANDVGSMMSGESSIEIGIPASQIQYFFYLNNLRKPEFAEILNYLKQKGINDATLQKYKVGAGVQSFPDSTGKQIDVKCVYYPLYQVTKSKKDKPSQTSQEPIETTLFKYKMQGVGQRNQKYKRLYPISAKTGFFGFNTICENDRVVVITQGQINAMSVNQQTGYPAISLPQGASSLPDQLIPCLSQFQKVVIWLDNDAAGHLAEDKISFKIGVARAYVIRNDDPQLKDANDYLRNAPQKMKSMIERSKTKPSQNILQFQDLKESVRNRIFRHEDYVGVPVDWIPYFNKKVKGIRMKELSVISGQTGCGKTTFLSQMTLDLCKKQIPVLWGSFEIKNQVLLTNMLLQFSGQNLYKNQDLFPHYAEQFRNLPLYFLSFHGSNDIQKVLATIQYSIQKHNISVVVLDTLQFLLADQGVGYQKFDLQDKVLSRLRRMATQYNIHIMIVIHPRKTQDNQDIQLHSVYGTSKATQQADNVWMIQKRQNFRIFDVKKNRFDGDIGKVAIGFNKNTTSYFQLTKNQLSQIFNNQKTIEQIAQNRAQKAKNKPEQTTPQTQTEENSTNFEFIQQIKKKRKQI